MHTGVAAFPSDPKRLAATSQTGTLVKEGRRGDKRRSLQADLNK